MNVAIIPARGGSKRIPRKNIKNFCGVPLISYSIRAAQKSGVFDAIIVSTDDHEIAEIALEYGAEVPFMRPPELSDDYAGTLEVINHSIGALISNGSSPSYVCCIYPTAPFLRAEDLSESLLVLKGKSLNFVFSASTFDYPIQRALRVDGEDIKMVSPEHESIRSQDLEEFYHDAGQFYWGAVDSWVGGVSVFGRNCQVYRIPRYRCIDIDTEEDWIMAEQMFSALASR